MVIYKILSGLILFCFIVACNKKVESSIIELNIEQAEIRELTDFLKLEKIIALESSEGFEIASIDKIIYNDNYIVLLDKKAKKVLVFDAAGKPLVKIKQNGKGRGEFLYPSDIDLVDDIIYISDNIQKKLLKFSLIGEFLGEEKIDFPISRMAICKTGNYYYAGYSGSKINIKNYNLAAYSESGAAFFMEFSPVKLGRDYFFIKSNTSFQKFNDHVLFSQPYNPNIYVLNENEIQAKYKINSSKFISPEILLKHWDNSKKLKKIIEFEKLDYCCLFTKKYEDLLFFVMFGTGDIRNKKIRRLYAYYYDEKHKTIYKSDLTDRDNLTNLNILNTDDDNIIGCFYPDVLLNNNISKNSKLKKYVDKMTVNDNPLLLVYNFK